jgi:hypothetical protein
MKKFVALALPMLVATTLLTLALASPVIASSPTYSFELTGPQITKDLAPATPSR